MTDWQPTASIEMLRKRAELFRYIREFFAHRDVMEVDTPVMSLCAVSDPFIDTVEVNYSAIAGNEPVSLYLQTSPEYAMKRLLAAGSGAVFQMSKVFRNGEFGRKHNPEFTMLEWYRPGLDDDQLMDEIEALITPLLDLESIERITYSDLFQRYLSVRPEELTIDQLVTLTKQHIEIDLEDDDPDTWLNLLISHVIEPQLTDVEAIFITDYPVSQAALAKVKQNSAGRDVAARFELFIRGMELANGYHELTDWQEQERRLLADQEQRGRLGLPQRPLDMRLVSALQAGMPECAGVALGVDRLLMLMTNKEQLAEVLSFSHANA